MSFVFIGIVQAIIVSIAYVYPRNAITIVTSEQVPETSSTFGLTITGWFVTTIETIIVSIAIPSSWYTSVIRTTEAIWRASPLCAM